MKCDDARAAYLAGDLGGGEREHLDTCAECRVEMPSLTETLRIMDSDTFWEEPPSGLEDRIVGLIAGPQIPQNEAPQPRRWQAALVGAAAVAAILVGAFIAQRPPSPDWEVALPGTAEAPLAVGVVSGWNEPSGTRMALDIEGLPPAPDGFIYEFWLSAGNLHISAGTFRQTEDVELWVGVTRAEFPRLWITLEPIDEDESPSGVNVMDTA